MIANKHINVFKKRCMLTRSKIYSIKILFSLLIISTGVLNAQSNIKCINIEEKIDPSVWNYLSEDIINSKIILIGETHNVSPNNVIRNSLFMYLNKYHGINNMLLEVGQSHAYLYNKYLETGDEKFLHANMPKSKKFGDRSIAVWKELYDHNLGLSEHERIKMIGLDFEREPPLSSSLLLLLEKDTLNINVKSIYEKIALRCDTIGFVMDNKTYVEWLRVEFEKFDFKKLSNSATIIDIVYNNSFHSNFYERDNYMVENFKKYYSKNKSYFGQFGTMHTQLDNNETFAGMLNSTDYNDKILSINLHYENYHYVYGEKVKYSFVNDIGFFKRNTIRRNKRFFDSVSDCNNFIYKIEPKSENLSKLRDKCQYIIYMNDAGER